MSGPSLPRNTDLVKDGQGSQPLMRFLDQVKGRAFSAVQSFNEFFQLDTIGESVDASNDYLLIYNSSASAAQKVAPQSLLSSGVPTVIETINVTATASIVFDDIPQDYSRILFLIRGVSRNSGTQALIMEVSNDNGSSYRTSNVVGAVTANTGGGAAVAGWSSGQALIFYVDNSLSHDGFVSIDNYAENFTIPKRIVSAGNRGSFIRAEGQGVTIDIGPINAVRLTLSNFAANGSITLVGYP